MSYVPVQASGTFSILSGFVRQPAHTEVLRKKARTLRQPLDPSSLVQDYSSQVDCAHAFSIISRANTN